MSEEATFDAIDQESNQVMYGPRAILLCGMSGTEQETVAAFAKSFGSLPVSVAGEQELDTRVGDLVLRPDKTGFGQDSALERLVLMSGLTEGEVHRFMAQYRQAGLARPLWATLTPTSATWPLSELLGELDAERRAMQAAMNPNS